MKTFIECLDAGLIELDGLTGSDVSAIRQCFVSRGKRKGLLKKAAPAHDGGLRGAFDGLMVNVAPVRVSIFARMMSSAEDQEQFRRIEIAFDPKFSPANFNLLNATCQVGGEFNLFAMRFDIETLVNILSECE